MTILEATIRLLRHPDYSKSSSEAITATGRYKYPTTLKEAFTKAKNHEQWQ